MPQRGALLLSGDAVEAQVMNPKTFYGNVLTKKTGTALINEVTVAIFQAIPSTGTFIGGSEGINDNDVGTASEARAIDQYAEVDFGGTHKIKRWRYYGHALNSNEDGHFKIQILTSAGWEDWVTGIPTRLASWTSLETETEAITEKIRIVCTKLDTGDEKAFIGEFEVIW